VFVALAGDVAEVPPLLPEEETLLSPRARPARRHDLAMGRAAARLALARLGGPPAPIMRGPHREPLWPDGVVGSITHAAGHALSAVAPVGECGGLGLDLEHRGRFFPALADHVAFAEEREWLAGCAEPDRPAATLALFSAKETIYKAFFPRIGRFFGFTAAQVTPTTDRGTLTGRLLAPLDPSYPTTRTFSIDVAWSGDLVLTSLALPPG